MSLELPRFSPFPSLEIGRERNGGFMRTRKKQLEVPLFSVGPMGKQLFQGDGSHPQPAQPVGHAGPMPRPERSVANQHRIRIRIRPRTFGSWRNHATPHRPSYAANLVSKQICPKLHSAADIPGA